MADSLNCEFTIDGMHCDTCELYISETMRKQQGVIKVAANATTQKVRVTFAQRVNTEEFQQKVSDQIEKQGYKIVDTVQVEEKNIKKLVFSALLAVIIFGIFLTFQLLNITSVFNPTKLTVPAIFLLGILASLSTCMAVVGGVAMTLSSRFASEHRSKAIIVFHISRLAGFVFLGGIIGLLGKIVIMTAAVTAFLRIVVGIIMITVGLDLVGVKVPKVVFPKTISQYFGIFDDKEGWTNAVMLGVATFFLPCAFTQSMQLYAVSTGSFIMGALVMGVFALGTLPVLSLISLGSATGIGRANKGIFGFTMGFLIVLFALLNIYSSLGIFGLVPRLSF